MDGGEAFVRKYDQSGTLLWHRQYKGSGANPEGAYAIAADSSGVYAAGDTDGALPGQTSTGMSDAYVLKYDHSGTLQWTRQFGSPAYDKANAIVVDSSGVYASGGTGATLSG
jgi:outer membrane protein assembly factor BamB